MTSIRDWCPGCNETGWACKCREPKTMPELPTSVVVRVGLAVAAELDAIDAELENVSALAVLCREEFRKQSSERIAQAAINAMPIAALEDALRRLCDSMDELDRVGLSDEFDQAQTALALLSPPSNNRGSE